MYLMLLMHFLENKVAVELTQSEFVEAQEVGDLSFFFYNACMEWRPLFVLQSQSFVISCNVASRDLFAK